MTQFSRFGAIKQDPVQTENEEHGKIKIQLDFYKIDSGFDYAIKAVIQNQVFTRYPHPAGTLFDSIYEARKDAYKQLENFCNNNKLKKQFNACLAVQPELFDI